MRRYRYRAKRAGFVHKSRQETPPRSFTSPATGPSLPSLRQTFSYKHPHLGHLLPCWKLRLLVLLQGLFPQFPFGTAVGAGPLLLSAFSCALLSLSTPCERFAGKKDVTVVECELNFLSARAKPRSGRSDTPWSHSCELVVDLPKCYC